MLIWDFEIIMNEETTNQQKSGKLIKRTFNTTNAIKKNYKD